MSDLHLADLLVGHVLLVDGKNSIIKVLFNVGDTAHLERIEVGEYLSDDDLL